MIDRKNNILNQIKLIRKELLKFMKKKVDLLCDNSMNINYLFTTFYKKNITNIKQYNYENFKMKYKYSSIIEYIFSKLIQNSINITYRKLKNLDNSSNKYMCQIINRNQQTFLDENFLLNFDTIKKVNLLFQYSSGYFVRPSQIKIIDKIKDCLVNNYSHIIQLVMGEGKSTFIIPYICFESVIRYNRSCIILIPNNEKLLIDMENNLVGLQNVFNIKIKLYNNINKNNFNLLPDIDVHLMSYGVFKELYYYYMSEISHNHFIKMIKNYFILIDEVDLFLKSNMCEMNVMGNDMVYPNRDKLKVLFNFIQTKLDNVVSRYHKKKDIDKMNDHIDIKLAEEKYIEFNRYAYNKDYGTSFITTDNFQLAKPYNYVNSPDLDSEFSDFHIKIYTTYLSYYKHKWTPQQIKTIYDLYLQILHKKLKKYVDKFLDKI